MKKNFIQMNKKITSQAKKVQKDVSPPARRQPVALPDKIKNIQNKLSKLQENNQQAKILQELKFIRQQIKQIKSNISFTKSNRKSNHSNEEDIDESFVVKTNKNRSFEKEREQEQEIIPSQQSIHIKQNVKLKKVKTIAKQIIPPSVLQAYLKQIKIDSTKPAPYYTGYVKKNSAPVFLKYSSKSFDKQSDTYRRLWKQIVKARWICINRLYENSQAQLNFLILDKNAISLDGLPVQKILVDILKILQFIHNSGYLYRNMSPQHFMLNSQGNLVILDFKNVRRYIDTKGNHLQVIQQSYQCGDFGSTAQLRLMAQGRKDDLQSLGYMALHFLIGEVEWAGMTRQQMMKCRNGLTLQQLYKSIPQWLQYMKYVHKLNRIQKPDYNKLIQLLKGQQ